MNNPCELKSTLRGHQTSVTALEFFHVPNTYTAENQLLTTTILSGDESGTIVWWDLITRRPIVKWKAHDNNILSIKQLGLRWELLKHDENGKKDCLVPRLGQFFGMLITHSRDNTLKIWNLAQYVDSITAKRDSALQKTVEGKFEVEAEDGYAKLEPVHSEPINSLNFCNVDVFDNKFCSLNKVNGDYFDINEIKYDEATEKYYLDPQYQGIDPKILLKNTTINYNNKEEKKELQKLGIIMKLLWISETSLYIGFESGHIISVNIPLNKKSLTFLDDSKIQQLENMLDGDNLKQHFLNAADGNTEAIAHLLYGDTSSKSGIDVISITSCHYPNPVLDLKYDAKSGTLFSSSTGAELVNHNIAGSEKQKTSNPKRKITVNADSNKIVDLKSIGISSMDVRIDDLVAITFWNGQVKFYQKSIITDNNNEGKNKEADFDLIKLPFKITKQKAQVTKEYSANPNDPEILANEKQLRRYKSNIVRISPVQSLASMDELIKQYKPKNVKNLLDYRRFLKNFRDNWVAVAYDDGCIGLYQVQASLF